MTYLSPTLAVLTLIGASASIHAASIADDLQLKVKGVIQARTALLAKGTYGDPTPGATTDAASAAIAGGTPGLANDMSGEEYDFYRGQLGKAERARFSIRRMRIGFDVKNTTGWFGNATLRADTIDTNAGGGTNTLAIYYAYVGKQFKLDPIDLELKLGLDKAATFGSLISSGTYVTANERPVSAVFEDPGGNRGVGAAFSAKSEFINLFADVMNNSTGTKDADASFDGRRNGVFYGFRLEFAPGKDWMPSKRQESYAGQEGKALVLGFDYHKDGLNYSQTPTSTYDYLQRDIRTFGPDLLARIDGLTAIAEYRVRISETDQFNTNGSAVTGASATKIAGKGMSAQVAYALPLENGLVVEPAVRFSRLDIDKDATEITNWTTNNENGAASGRQFDLGLNFYWNAHANKTQVNFTTWRAEDGDGKGRVAYVQHQLTF